MSGLRVQVATFNANLQGAETTRPDLTPWLVPTVDQTLPIPTVSSSSSASSSTTLSAPLSASRYRSTNPRTPTSHPSLPREAPDFYAVGFQELVPLHVGFASTSDQALYDTDLDIRKSVRAHQAVVSGNGMYAPPEQGGGPEAYALLCRVDLVGIALFVYARERVATSSSQGARSAAARVREIRTARVGTGLAGVMGNKGGVGVRIVVASADENGADEVLTFVCAHLAAHDHNVERRNHDWKQIVQRMVFVPASVRRLPIVQDSKPRLDPGNMEALRAQYEASNPMARSKQTDDKAGTALDAKSYTVYDTTHLLVFGDLNHRIALGPAKVGPANEKGSATATEPLTKDLLASHLQSRDWASFQPFDQLTGQRLASPPRAFHGLTELSFEEMQVAPTYKYKPVRDTASASGDGSGKKKGSHKKQKTDKAANGADGQELSKKRVPGWTDRVLWASAAAEEAQGSGAGAGAGAFDKQGVEVEFYRSVMEMVHSDHKPVTTLLCLPRPPRRTSTTAPLLSSRNPYEPLPASQRQALALIGLVLDRLVGYLWTGVILLGGGNLVSGMVELAVLGAITAWWLGRSDGGGDLAWWIHGRRTSA